MTSPTNESQPSTSLPHARPRSPKRAGERDEMVRTQIAARGVRDERVLAAMRNVPRQSGYQAAILAELTDEVFTIEIVEPLGTQARRVFHERGYAHIRSRIGDGYRGWPEASPFDAIIVTCAPESVPQPLIDQLAGGGRLCIPVGAKDRGGQTLIVLTKRPDGSIQREDKTAVRFVPMTGKAAGE